MAKKISQLTQATEVKSDDVTVIVQDGETKKLPLNMMVTKQDIENKKIAGLAKLDEIEATYENDTYTPTITVKNKSSVKTGEGDEVDYSANVMDGHVKSAILSGQTLVNVSGESITNLIINTATPKYLRQHILKQGVVYTFVFDVEEVTGGASGVWGRFNYTDGSFENIQDKAYTTGITKVATSFDKELNNIYIGWIRNHATGQSVKFRSVMILEGDWTDKEIPPYFDGMQSVKMPVLTTTGKNLVDTTSMWFDGYASNSSEIRKSNSTKSLICKVKPNTTYTFTRTQITNRCVISSFKGNHKDLPTTKQLYSDNASYTEKSVKFTTLDDTEYVIIYVHHEPTTPNGWVEHGIYQLEEGSTATTYEPFKSNILSTPEDVVLGKVEEFEDTINTTNGELIIKTKEISYTDSKIKPVAYISKPNSFYLRFIDKNPTKEKLIISDTIMQTNNWGSFMNNNSLCSYSLANANLYITIPNATTVEDADAFLTELNPTFRYVLAESTIKTVDLMPSGTHPSTTPYCWKNGHIQLSSSGLLPSLEYSVVTSRAGQINQNATMVVKNDKRIFDLEILLAGGLVNTTYQALTLQNQVETGLSKASLNSETEPDYLLYHMIMKLIEEKAYKLDDLTEKVSVFYLYEKLSDEQFETIYSALYPFVEEEYIELPEDGEIIEEPVVDELPKEVEDEVVM